MAMSIVEKPWILNQRKRQDERRYEESAGYHQRQFQESACACPPDAPREPHAFS